jgi:23S rRNA (adenine2030-N6)-methyltransferase
VHPDDSPLRLNGSGMVILNAPWNLDKTLRDVMPAMARLLSQERPAEWLLDWLVQENEKAPDSPSSPYPTRLPPPKRAR